MNILPFAKLHSSEKSYPLVKGSNILGRNPETCSLILPHQSISNQHCEITINYYTKEIHIRDLTSRNGTFLNGKRLPLDIFLPLKENDVLRFGKDHTMYKLILLPFSLNDKVSFNDNQFKNNSTPIDHLNKRTPIQHNEIISNSHNDEYEKLEYKHNALMKYASDLQKENDKLIKENKELMEVVLVKERENTEMNMKLDSDEQLSLIKEKEKVIEILRAEVFYMENEIEKVAHMKGIDTHYIEESISLKKTVQQYKHIVENMNVKWNEIVNENERLKMEMKYFQSIIENIQKNSIELVGKHDETIKEFLTKVKRSLSDFNKESGNYLIEQVKGVIKDKENALREVIMLSNRNKQLEYINNKLAQDLVQVNEQLKQKEDLGNVQNVIKQLQDKIAVMRVCYAPEKVVELEKMIAKLTVGVDTKVINKNDNIGKFEYIRSDGYTSKEMLVKEGSDTEKQKYVNKEENDNNKDKEQNNNNLDEIRSISNQMEN